MPGNKYCWSSDQLVFIRNSWVILSFSIGDNFKVLSCQDKIVKIFNNGSKVSSKYNTYF